MWGKVYIKQQALDLKTEQRVVLQSWETQNQQYHGKNQRKEQWLFQR